MIILLFVGAKKFGTSSQLSKISRSKFVLIIISSFAMGLFLWVTDYLLKKEIVSLIEKISFASFLVLMGAAIYIFVANFLGAFSIKEIQEAIKKS